MEHHRRTFAAVLLASSACLLASLPALAGQQSALPCSGIWTAHGDSERPLFALKRDVDFEMQVHQCGAAVSLYRIDNGEEVALTRTSRSPNTFVWTQSFRGRTIGWRLLQRAPDEMSLVFFGDGAVLDSSPMTYLHPLPRGTMALLAAECEAGADDAAAFDDPKTPEQAQALGREKHALDALLSIMRSRDLAPPAESGLSLRDYVSVSSTPADGTDEVQLALRVARDGSLLPEIGTFSIDYTRCVVDQREYEPADKTLAFEIIPLLDADPDGESMAMTRVTRYSDGTQTSSRQPLKRVYYTQAKLLDAGTSEIIKAQDAGFSEPLDLGESIDTALLEMDLGPLRLDDGFSEP